ncbi:trimeric intracellular cation channel type B [Drosophila subobscura]|uniref:trimeric intracellular cation channel type B n=1 Tax=Drosophila subobscura TaxID=7241 RepID=UPI00155ADB8E|nr:trimeric intracellular cation channel type B [Drosophila subobscura]
MNAQLILRQFPNHIMFRTLHYSLMAEQLREEIESRSGPKGKRRSCLEWEPFALWLTNTMLIYAGDILGNLLLGTLPLEPLCNSSDVLLSSCMWYLIFYCPFDLGHSVAQTVFFRILATTMSTISQVQLIDKGVTLAGNIYGNAPVAMLVVGTIMGSGAELLKPVAALLINRCQHNQMARLKLSINSKLALAISSLFALHIRQSPLLCGLTQNQLQVYTLVLVNSYKYLSLAYRTEHFVWLMETRVRYTFFGGLTADLTKFFQRLLKPDKRRRKAFSTFDLNRRRWR